MGHAVTAPESMKDAARAAERFVAPLPAGRGAPEWVMVGRTGVWLGHPEHPEVVTPQMLQSAHDYFQRHHAAHGADLVVDYHHASVAVPSGAERAHGPPEFPGLL